MNKTALLIFCLLCVSLAHKDPRPQNVEIKSIYKPFTDVPKPTQDQVGFEQEEKVENGVHDHEKLTQDKQKQYQQFNEMLKYGLVIGTFLLSIMLVRTCSIQNGPQRLQRIEMAAATQNYMVRAPMLNKNMVIQLRNRIEWHKNEIKRLEEQQRQAEEAERKVMEEKRRQEERRAQNFKLSENQMQMHQTIPREFYSQQVPYRYEYYENIPMGRPLARDNDSSFASEYPTL